MDAGILLCVVLVLLFISLVFVIFFSVLRSPFNYPYFHLNFDVSGKRAPNPYDLIDHYLCENGFDDFEQHDNLIKTWKNDCKKIIEKSKFKELRTNQYNDVLDDSHAFRFDLVRKQTRYRQSNYAKTSYQTYVTVMSFQLSYNDLKQRYETLSSMGFECTLSEYCSKSQRKLMTKELRNKIAIRDNYTCQNCGKYMPDGVGLHIDHIVPISKGGKSVPSNLQVLCSKCNGRKSDN